MADNRYFGSYLKFETPSKDYAGPLMGSNNAVGDAYSLDFRTENGVTRAWLVNQFGGDIGYLNEKASYRMQVLQAQDKTIVAYLSFVAFTSTPEPGTYWGEVAVVAYNNRYQEELGVFCNALAEMLSNGIRPDIDLNDEGVDRLLASKGEWMPKERVPLPEKSKNFAIIKKDKALSDKMIAQGRKGNIGCYIISWAFIAALAVGAFFLLKGFFGF